MGASPPGTPKVRPELPPGLAWPCAQGGESCRGRVHLLCDFGHGELPSWSGGLTGLWGQKAVSQSVRCHPSEGSGPGGAAAFRSCLGKAVRSTVPLLPGRHPKGVIMTAASRHSEEPFSSVATVRAAWDEYVRASGRPCGQHPLQLCPEALDCLKCEAPRRCSGVWLLSEPAPRGWVTGPGAGQGT